MKYVLITIIHTYHLSISLYINTYTIKYIYIYIYSYINVHHSNVRVSIFTISILIELCEIDGFHKHTRSTLIELHGGMFCWPGLDYHICLFCGHGIDM